MEDFKIGDEIHIVLKVVETEEKHSCMGCIFSCGGLCYSPTNIGIFDKFYCLKESRTDKKNVMFKLVSCNTETKGGKE